MDRSPHIKTLLNDLIKDNPTYPFPISTIEKELTQLLVMQDEYDYFMWMALKKIRKEHGDIVAKIYLTTAEVVMDLTSNDIYQIPYTDYYQLIDKFYEALLNLRITRLDKNSSDGEMLKAML